MGPSKLLARTGPPISTRSSPFVLVSNASSGLHTRHISVFVSLFVFCVAYIESLFFICAILRLLEMTPLRWIECFAPVSSFHFHPQCDDAILVSKVQLAVVADDDGSFSNP